MHEPYCVYDKLKFQNDKQKHILNFPQLVSYKKLSKDSS